MDRSRTVPRHPIRVVAKRTGLTPPTIRAWERRYGVVRPGRSEGGQRLYTDEDLERLGTLRELTEMGRSIGMVAALPPEAAATLLVEDRASSPPRTARERGAAAVDTGYASVLAFDDAALERLLWRSVLTLEATSFLDDVIAPLLDRVGRGWEEGELTTAQEHLASEVIDRVLAWMIDTASAGPGAPRLVVATLQGERHRLGARLVAATAVVEGCAVTYLGADLPASDVASAVERVAAATVAVSFVLPEALDQAGAELVELRRRLPDSIDVLVGGAAAVRLAALGLPAGVRHLEGLEDLRTHLRRRASRAPGAGQ